MSHPSVICVRLDGHGERSQQTRKMHSTGKCWPRGLDISLRPWEQKPRGKKLQICHYPIASICYIFGYISQLSKSQLPVLLVVLPSSSLLRSCQASLLVALAMARAPLLLFASLCLVAFAGGANAAERKTVGVYELKKGDFSVKVTNWGATIMSVILPDSKGNLADVTLGYDTIAEYVNGSGYFGALVGRVANRIAKARFVLDGKVYHLYANDGKNALHGGHRGFSKVIWTVKEYVGGGDSPYITLYYHSFDGEQGFPGDLDVYVTYQLSSPYVLSVHMNATAVDKATPVNLAQHTYWNLGGQGSGDVLGNTVQLFASRYTPVDGALIPTGQVAPVAGTPYDLRAPTPVGAHVHQVSGGSSNGSTVYGYDMNYAVDGDAYALRRVAVVRDGASGRALELWANQPGVQFYTGNFLKNVKGKGGKVYTQYGALCLETQGFPDAVNHPNFPSQIVRPGQVYKHDMVFKFSF